MIEHVIEARQHDLGGGLTVGRVLPHPERRSIGPFVFLDHFGPASFAPGLQKSADVRPHPHIGLSTLTYLFAGEITHRDSLGSEVEIQPCEVNWMTAGRGVTHSERFETLRAQGGPLHGVQAWVALPAELEEMAPAFAHHGPEDLPTLEEAKLWARLAAGAGFHAKAKVQTHSPMLYVHWRLKSGGRAQYNPEYSERAALVCSGGLELDGHTFRPGQMLILKEGKPALFTATHDSEVMLLGGEPLGREFVEWNFVSSRKERIDQAKADWRAGRMKLPDLDHDEFIPLPPDPPPPANPIS